MIISDSVQLCNKTSNVNYTCVILITTFFGFEENIHYKDYFRMLNLLHVLLYMSIFTTGYSLSFWKIFSTYVDFTFITNFKIKSNLIF